jgi:hypothetical protein
MQILKRCRNSQLRHGRDESLCLCSRATELNDDDAEDAG